MSGIFQGKIYYKLKIKLISPLTVGSGNNNETDHDVITDGKGRPVIPGTSIAGAIRSYICQKCGKELAETIFGRLKSETQTSKDTQLKIYDALTDSNISFITNRDCVALDEKISIEGAKFDFQAVEPGVEFVSYIEISDSSCSEKTEEAFSAIHQGIIRFGAKTTRGYGQVSLEVYKKEIKTVEEYIDFDMYKEDCWNDSDKIEISKDISNIFSIKVYLKSVGGISVRRYSTEVDMPDYESLYVQENGKHIPVIPGTAWAGVFRHRIKDLTGTDPADIFGDVDKKNKTASKSKIMFSESRLEKGIHKNVSRNSIDRFSGATKNSSLYTERTYYDGETELDVIFPKSMTEKYLPLFAVCLADLHNGFITAGGLSSVGRGLFHITKITVNGRELTEYITGENVNIKGFVKEVENNDIN